ncbi:50S ribosomal protein L17, chloroplastic isoform X2 [Amborella trichopoda]|uniref:50S ribosomal protein L17, chloroplastic isoform X2 n=1 Tax=Amborella trichopoda TaxID=13333 RepID=UPI0005D422E2|nr:50S ribosomal protein L17, chloroplastic isoform X2 [Amborella trichopoda]|eukprot:XP_011621763.1 50S ribosomal protein L17, chloroplastic isoform X2 [Amborella trichopoda]
MAATGLSTWSMAATGLSTWSMASLRSALPTTPVARKFRATGSYFPAIKTTHRKPPAISRSFSGLAIANPLPIKTDCVDVDYSINLIDNGGRVYACDMAGMYQSLTGPQTSGVHY